MAVFLESAQLTTQRPSRHPQCHHQGLRHATSSGRRERRLSVLRRLRSGHGDQEQDGNVLALRYKRTQDILALPASFLFLTDSLPFRWYPQLWIQFARRVPRRQFCGQPRCHPRCSQLSAQRVWLFELSTNPSHPTKCRVGEKSLPNVQIQIIDTDYCARHQVLRSETGAAMGPTQHPRLWRRSCSCHHLWTSRRSRQVRERERDSSFLSPPRPTRVLLTDVRLALTNSSPPTRSIHHSERPFCKVGRSRSTAKSTTIPSRGTRWLNG
jgi:hypothetical protein